MFGTVKYIGNGNIYYDVIEWNGILYSFHGFVDELFVKSKFIGIVSGGDNSLFSITSAYSVVDDTDNEYLIIMHWNIMTDFYLFKKMPNFDEFASLYNFNEKQNDSDKVSPNTVSEMCSIVGYIPNKSDNRIIVALIDTGVYPHHEITEPLNRVIMSIDLVNGFSEMYDDNGHGTAMAGIITANGYKDDNLRGVSATTDIISIKAYDYQGRGSVDTVIDAIEWVVSNKNVYDIKIIHLSFGLDFTSDPIKSKELISAVERAYDEGLLIVTAVGNLHGQSAIYVPANSEKVLAVGSSNIDINTFEHCFVSEFTSYWKNETGYFKPDIIAPGENIEVLGSYIYFLPDGKLSGRIVQNKVLSGTSVSAALVTGIVADIWSENPNLSNTEIFSMIKKHTYTIDYNEQSFSHISFRDNIDK